MGRKFSGRDGPDSGSRRRIAFVSSNSIWGGSEELWTAAAASLKRRGHAIYAAKAGMPATDRRVALLQGLQVPLTDLRRPPFVSERWAKLIARFCIPLDHLIRHWRFGRFLARSRPELVVLSQGGNLDGMFYAKRLRRAGLPYVLIVQKAAEMYWPSDDQLPEMQATYQGASRVFFVSQHNLRLTESQIAAPLPQGVVVRNPFLVPYDAPLPWPTEQDGLRLACIGRFFPREKGQDILLRVLARPKWRERNVTVTFYGSGPHGEALRQMAQFLQLTSVTFAGQTTDIAAVWHEHHALALPSHCEGLPLVLVEAMLCGRVPIVTAVAGNPEVVQDGATGFLAAAPIDDGFDEALERAWQSRQSLAAIGAAAARAIRELVPPSPETVFADAVLACLATDEDR